MKNSNLIRVRPISFLISFVLMLFMYSCTSELDNIGYDADNEHIKSVSANGAIVQNYLYNQTGEIIEDNCIIYFSKYIYDENGRLIKVESAHDQSMYSSSSFTERRTEFMTSKNSAVDHYDLYHYDNVGRLSEVEHYFLRGTDFEYISMTTFEYEGGYIVRENLHNSTGQITSYRVYTYDTHGNVTCKKYYYSNHIDSKYELSSETLYKYDNYNNPYRIYNILGSPGIHSNANNIIETNTIRYDDIPGIDKESSSKTTYEYNEKGYPIKEIAENGEFEYHY